MHLFLILGILLIAASPASADEVRLKNGSVISGRIVKEDKDVVIIEIGLGRGRMNLARRDIVQITISRVEPVEPATGSPAPGGRNPANPPTDPVPLPTRRVRATPEETPPADAGSPRTAAALPNRRYRGAPTPGPNIVAVERVPVQAAPAPVGPESDAPPRKSPGRSPDSKGNASNQTTSRATPKPDW